MKFHESVYNNNEYHRMKTKSCVVPPRIGLIVALPFFMKIFSDICVCNEMRVEEQCANEMSDFIPVQGTRGYFEIKF